LLKSFSNPSTTYLRDSSPISLFSNSMPDWLILIGLFRKCSKNKIWDQAYFISIFFFSKKFFLHIDRSFTKLILIPLRILMVKSSYWDGLSGGHDGEILFCQEDHTIGAHGHLPLFQCSEVPDFFLCRVCTSHRHPFSQKRSKCQSFITIAIA